MFLKQSTAQTVRFGPCLDKDDGVTEETALTLAQADMRLSKDGAAFAQKSAAGNATHDSDGWYSTSLSTTDTDTVGELILNVHQPANMLPVWMRFYVVEEAVYDDLFAASADPFTVLQSDVAAIHSQTTVIESDTVVISSDTAAIHSDTTIIASDVVILVSDTTAIHSQTTVIESDTVVISSDTAAIHSDTTIIASDVVQVYSDTTIIASDAVVLVAAVSDVESSLVIVKSDLVISNSDTAAIHSDTTIIASDVVIVASDAAAIHSDTTIIASDLVIAASDVALLEAAQSEPGSVPAANASPLDKLAFLGALARNKVTQTATTQTLRNDADSGNIGTSTVSDDGTTATRGEWT